MIAVVCFACAIILNVVRLQAGNSKPPPPSSYDSQGVKIIDAIAELGVAHVLASAVSLAGGPRTTSFADLSLPDLQKANIAAHLQLGQVTGVNNISVNLCADGPACTSVEAASQGNRDGTCWLGKVEAIPNASVVTTYGWTNAADDCTAGIVGSPGNAVSGWRASEPVWPG
jgi:hypothetical protein